MPIPDFQTVMLPLVRLSAQDEHSVSQAVDQLATEFGLSDDERSELLPSGKQTKFANRVHWSLTHLVQAGLIERPRRGYFLATDLGEQVMASAPTRIDMAFLSQYESYREFRQRRRSPDQAEPASVQESGSETPEERVDTAYEELAAALRADLLARVTQMTPGAFEKLIIDLMRGMGYGKDGSSKHLGRSSDGGVDGVINEDLLGLDTIYLQAKRYEPGRAIGVEKIREFAGALDERRAMRGVFVTTTHFAAGARDYAEKSPKRLILIDGDELTQRMIEHGVAVRTYRTIDLKKIDSEYFDEIEG